jgi:hypothetical protein
MITNLYIDSLDVVFSLFLHSTSLFPLSIVIGNPAQSSLDLPYGALSIFLTSSLFTGLDILHQLHPTGIPISTTNFPGFLLLSGYNVSISFAN